MRFRFVWVTIFTVAVLLSFGSLVQAQTGTPVFSNLPSPTPSNVPSQGFQCCATSEIGDEIQLEADTPRHAGFTTVLMSSWSLRTDYPALPNSGYAHPITLNIYQNATDAANHFLMATLTQTFTIPWRPVADLTCPGGTGWKAANGNCYNGMAFTITFDLRSLNLVLPDQFIYGIAYDTNSWGYNPIGLPGPYESLNVGTANVAGVTLSPTVGTDVNPDVVYWNTSYGPFYTDGGAAGINIFRPDTGWSAYPIAVKFTTFDFATSAEDCKRGGWQNVVRSDYTRFKNQGACMAYIKAGGDHDGHDRDDRDDHGEHEHGDR